MTRKEQILNQLNLKLPIVSAPMFIVSQQQLVIEACKNGIIGTFPALNNRSTAGFEEWCIEIKNELAKAEEATGEKLPPYGVNLIVHGSNPRMRKDLEICVKQKVPIIITSLGAVSDLVDAVHSYGGLVFHDVTNRRHAEKAIEANVDGLILVAAGAGGHGGLLNPIPFVNEIREMFDGVILLGGALSNGKDVATALQMGADLAYMGTRFINTNEATASDEYKDMIINSATKDIVYTAAISGINGNYLLPSLEAAGITKELLESKAKIDLGEKLDSNAKAWLTIWSAGQGVTSIKDSLPVAELVARLGKEFKEAINNQMEYLKKYT